MTLLLVGLLALLPLKNVLLVGGTEVIRVYAIAVALAWLAGYMIDPRNRERIGSLAPWFLGAMVAATAIAVPFAVDPATSAVRWVRLLVLWLAFTVAMPATFTDATTRRRATLVFVVAGAIFGLLNYHQVVLSPLTFFRELADSPTRFVIRSAFAYGRGAELHGHEVGHFTTSAILFGLGLYVSARESTERRWLTVLLAFASGALLISFTKSAWGGLVVGLVVFHRRVLRQTSQSGQVVRWSWVPVVVVLVLAATFWFGLPPSTKKWLVDNFLFRDVSGQLRFVLWAGAIDLARAHPMVGGGLNSLILTTGDPHNWWLGMLAEGGLVSFGCGAAFFYCLWRELTAPRQVAGDEFVAIRGAAAAVVASIAFQGLLEASFLWDYPTWAALGLATSIAGWPSVARIAAVASPATVAPSSDVSRRSHE